MLGDFGIHGSEPVGVSEPAMTFDSHFDSHTDGQPHRPADTRGIGKV